MQKSQGLINLKHWKWLGTCKSDGIVSLYIEVTAARLFPWTPFLLAEMGEELNFRFTANTICFDNNTSAIFYSVQFEVDFEFIPWNGKLFEKQMCAIFRIQLHLEIFS